MPRMPRGKALTAAQNDALRKLIREELLPRYGSQSALAPKLGMSQPALSSILCGRNGSSVHIVEAAAKLAGVDPSTLLFSSDGSVGIDRELDKAMQYHQGRVPEALLAAYAATAPRGRDREYHRQAIELRWVEYREAAAAPKN